MPKKRNLKLYCPIKRSKKKLSIGAVLLSHLDIWYGYFVWYPYTIYLYIHSSFYSFPFLNIYNTQNARYIIMRITCEYLFKIRDYLYVYNVAYNRSPFSFKVFCPLSFDFVVYNVIIILRVCRSPCNSILNE